VFPINRLRGKILSVCNVIVQRLDLQQRNILTPKSNKTEETKLRGMSQRADYTDRNNAACRLS
jgi:hypothetical protein